MANIEGTSKRADVAIISPGTFGDLVGMVGHFSLHHDEDTTRPLPINSTAAEVATAFEEAFPGGVSVERTTYNKDIEQKEGYVWSIALVSVIGSVPPFTLLANSVGPTQPCSVD